MSHEQQDALKIAGTMGVTRAQRDNIAAALLEARATGYQLGCSGRCGQEHCPYATRLRAEAHALREG
jgi:ribosome modulation factor